MFGEDKSAVYYSQLSLENVKCFKGRNSIDFSDEHDNIAQWTILIGENNTGKTTLLRSLADMIPVYNTLSKNKESCLPRGFLKLAHVSKDELHQDNIVINSKKGVVFHNLLGYGNEYFFFNSLDNSPVSAKHLPITFIDSFFLAYGTSRKISKTSLSESEKIDVIDSIYDDSIRLLNIEEWLLRTYLAIQNGKDETKAKAEKVYRQIEELFLSGVFPEIKTFRITTDKKLNSFVEFFANNIWVRLEDLGSGYQSSITWLVDLAKRMFDRYPDAENPLAMPAVVLVDEIDLHLHPKWQREIIAFLSKLFPQTQFIVTSHSPLVVQSANNINVVLLEKEGDDVKIRQPRIPTYQGWSVEEILSELMGLGDKTHSQVFLDLMENFDKSIQNEDYLGAKSAYDTISSIVHENSVIPKSLRLQMSSLLPVSA